MLKRVFPRYFLLIFLSLTGLVWAVSESAAQDKVSIVSAATFESQVAFGSIATAYGVGLSKNVVLNTASPLPTSLDGTTVTIRDSAGQERLAPLFFVSPGQINLQIPAGTATGSARFTVRASDGKVSVGDIEVAAVAPGFFTANVSGRGVPAAEVLRVRGSALIYEGLSQGTYPNIEPKPIDLGPAGEMVFLVLYATGLKGVPDTDGNPNNGAAENVRVMLGGVAVSPEYVGPSPFTGVEQINVLIPRELFGRGRINLSLTGTDRLGGVAKRSNQVEVAIASGKCGISPRVDRFTTTTRFLAGQPMTIQGAGFSVKAEENLVRIGELEARVISATPTQLVVEIPFGARRGKLNIINQQCEGASQEQVDIETSISGLVTDTSSPPQPLRGVRVEAVRPNGQMIVTTTSERGSFVLPGMEPTPSLPIHIEGSTVATGLPYTSLDTRVRVLPNQDNRFATPLSLQLLNGNSARLSGDSAKQNQAESGGTASYKAQNPIRLEVGGVVLEIPAGATIASPNGAPGTLSLTAVEGSRVPAALPEAIFSRRIVQITPFGFRINPGAKLTFPNSDDFPPGAKVDLYTFDKNAAINAEEAFRKIGEATVSANGAQIETEAGAVTLTSYFFVSRRRLKTLAIGQVVEAQDNNKPVQQAIVQVRGQGEFTDGNGGFVPRETAIRRDPATNQLDRLQAEVISQRADGRVIYTDRSTPPAQDGITNFGTIPLNLTTNLPPVVLIASEIRLSAGQPSELKFTAYDPDSQMVTIGRMLARQGTNGNPNPNFVQLTLDTTSAGNHLLRFTPQQVDIGEYILTITVQDEGAQQLSVRRTVSITVVGTPAAVVMSAGMVNCDLGIPSGPSVELTWTTSSLATIYDVYRGNNELLGSISGTRFVDKPGLTAGRTYSYYVIARNPSGDSPPSNILSVAIPQNVCFSKQVTVSFLPATGTLSSGGTIMIPVQIGDLTGRNVIAYEFSLGFDSAILQFLGDDSPNTLSSGMRVIHNASGNTLKVAAFVGSQIGGPERTLIRLRFLVKGSQGQNTPLRWIRFMLNEGDPLPSLNDGSFIVR